MEKEKPLYLKNTLVGFFDIMGYSNFIESPAPDFQTKINKIKRLFDINKSTCDTDMLAVKLHSWVLSDSLIVVVDTDRHPLFNGSINVLLYTCSAILNETMSISNMPVRGAIGGGDFYKSDDLLISSALVDAANFEKKQEWLGAVLSPNAKTIIEKHSSNFFTDMKSDIKSVLKYGPVPMKHGAYQDMHYIHPLTDRGNPNWIRDWLPDYFDPNSPKIKNSDILYGVGQYDS